MTSYLDVPLWVIAFRPIFKLMSYFEVPGGPYAMGVPPYV